MEIRFSTVSAEFKAKESQRERAQRPFGLMAYKLRPLCHTQQPPAPRGGATLTQLSNGDVYLIGGADRNGMSFQDVHKLNLDSQLWTQLQTTGDAFPARCGHSAVAVGLKIYVFGGLDPRTGHVFDDLYVLHTQTQQWTHVPTEGDVPAPRNSHAAILLPSSQQQQEHEDSSAMLMYGGSSPQQGALGDVFLLQIPADSKTPHRWERQLVSSGLAPEPAPRELHCAVQIPGTGARTICFVGGRTRDGELCSDLLLLSLDSWTWRAQHALGDWRRCSHVAGVVDGSLVSVGGWDGERIRADCWRFHAGRWAPAIVESRKRGAEDPEAHATLERFGHCACQVAGQENGLLVFGGMTATLDLNDLVLLMS